MKKSSGIILILVLIIIGFAIFIWGNSANKSNSASADQVNDSSSETTIPDSLVSGDIVMNDAIATIYYGNGCSHCAALESWLQKNGFLPSGDKIDQASVDSWIKNAKVKFNMKEIYYNNKNNAELSQNAEKAGIDSGNIGVPFLYDIKNNKSHIGEDEIQNFLNS